MKLRLLVVALLAAQAACGEADFPLIQSSEPLTLDSLIALGLRHNPALRETVLNTRLNRIGRTSAVGEFLPKISTTLSFSETHRAAGNTRFSDQDLMVTESLFEGGRRYYQYRMARVQEDINNVSVEEARKNLAGGIAQQVMLVLTREKLLDLARKLRDQRRDARDLAKARYEVGSVTELDVLQAEIELGSAENAITSAQRDLQAAREALNQLLGIDLRSTYPIAEAAQPSPFTFDVDALVSEAYRYRTDLKLKELAVLRAKHDVNANRSDYLPSASISWQFSRTEEGGGADRWTLDPKRETQTVALNLRWTLFDGFSREYNVATRRVAWLRAAEQERALRLQLEKEVRDAYYNLEKVYNQLAITARNRDLAERTLNLERERYRLGATSQLGLRDAQFMYEQAETENLRKILEYQSSLIALELAVGRSLR